MPTASPESNNHLKPGEINFDLIPKDWALTPLQGKRAYIAGWTTQPYSVEEIKRCLLYTSPSPRDSMTSRMPSSA